MRSRPTGVSPGRIDESLDGSTTAAYLHSLRNSTGDRRTLYNAIKARFDTFFHGLTFEALGESGQAPYLVLVDLRHPEFDIDQGSVGTGVVEVLTLIANLERREGHVVVIEEPELHLHPQHQRALMDLIVDASSSNQVFVITHSTHFIDPDHLGGLTRVSASTSGVDLSHFPIDENAVDDKELATIKQNMRLPEAREMFFASAILLVEGETEAAYLRSIAPRIDQSLDARGITVIAVGGGDKGLYRPYMRVLESLGLPFLCQRDKGPDGIPKDWLSKFRFTGAEFEQYMRAQGHSALIDEAESQVGANHKPQVGRFLGDHMEPSEVPKVFRELLADVIALLA